MANDRDSLIDEGVRLQHRGHIQAALACYEKALAIDPASARAHHDRASALLSLKRHKEALASCEAALALDPGYIPALHDRGYVLQALGRNEEAVACYDRILAVEPDFEVVLRNRGTALKGLNRLDEAIASYDRAIALRPDRYEALWDKGAAMLASGDLSGGFQAREARWDTPLMRKFRPDTPAPQWRGAGPLEGKTILLHAEGGLGDSIQFVRYAPLLAGRGARLILRLPVPLCPLFERLAGVDQIIKQGDPLPPHDLHCSLMSLPYAFGTTLATIPDSVPYLEAPPDRVAYWKQRLLSRGGPVGGIVWAGNPAHPSDSLRSIPLSAVLPCLTPNVTWISLQKVIPDRDRRVLEGATHLIRWGEEDRGLADSAAQIKCLDFIIAVDTALAHLAGALARPVWILLMYGCDWRWMRERTDSPWYPTARLFRQEMAGDWTVPVEQVRRCAATR
jgi:Tfp pilus assembly protein PilF